MSIGIVTEYNPFHYGHLYQLNTLKNMLNLPLVICMSGNFVQRGMPSILDKEQKTRIALSYGVDLVTEIPAAFVSQSAQNYAHASVYTLYLCGITHLAFGVESSFSEIIKLAEFQLTNEKKLAERMRYYKSNYHHAMLKSLNDLGYKNIILKSNDYLALEYVKFILKNKLPIQFVPLQRQGSDYTDTTLNYRYFNSATALRKAYFEGKSIRKYLPQKSYEALLNRPHAITALEIFHLFRYRLLIENAPVSKISGYEKGMDSLFLKSFNQTDSYENLITLSSNFRYRPQRLQRFIINYLLNITHDLIDQSLLKINYVNILGFNVVGIKLLSNVKKDTFLITNYKNVKRLPKQEQTLYSYHLTSSRLYYGKTNTRDYHAFPIKNTSSSNLIKK